MARLDDGFAGSNTSSAKYYVCQMLSSPHLNPASHRVILRIGAHLNRRSRQLWLQTMMHRYRRVRMDMPIWD
jgi:hypothetical protein